MRTLLLVLLLAPSALALPDRTEEVAALYRRMEGLAEDARASADSLRRLEERGGKSALKERPDDGIAAAELHLLGTGPDRAFLAARAAWRFLAATKGGGTANEADRRRARLLYDLACGACAASVDWTKDEWTVGNTQVRLVRRGLLAGALKSVVPAGLQPTKDYGELVTTDGVGGAVTVVMPETKERKASLPYLVPGDFAYAATALLRFDGDAPRLELLDPLELSTVPLFGESMPLMANFTAPFAAMAAGIDFDELAMEGLETPRLDMEALYMLQPPRNDRIPVLFVHGLKSSPRAYRKLALALRADATIRRRFQFVAYQYPTGYPLALLNARLRKVMEDFWTWFDERVPRAREHGYVAVGHSMGGLQVRSLAVSSGRRVWKHFFTRSPTEVDLSGPAGEFLRRIVLFEPDPKLARLIFLAVPHRGSPLAAGPVGKVGSAMVDEDPIVRDFRAALLKRYGDQLKPEIREAISRPRTSIDNLDPNSGYLKELAGLPLRPGLPFHSIIGDLRGDLKAPTGDGIVPYESAHLEGAASELIVKSGHSVQATPQAIAEVKRILMLHLAETEKKD